MAVSAKRATLPALTRSRGMASAAILGGAVTATYAAMTVASLHAPSARTLLHFPARALDAAATVAFHHGHHPPVRVVPGESALARQALLVRTSRGFEIHLGRLQDASVFPDVIHLQNTTGRPQHMQLAVSGAPGVQATFTGSGTTGVTVAPRQAAAIALRSSASVAGPISGTLSVAVGRHAPMQLPLVGAQAPAAPGPASAQPAAGGAVHVSWTPAPSTGVAGYQVLRAPAGGAYTPVSGTVNALDFTDTTAADGTAYSYRVRAVAAAVTPALAGPADAAAAATADASAPAAPLDVSVPTISAANEAAVPVHVDLPASSSTGDSVSVSLSDGAQTVAAPASPGGAAATFTVDASPLADGPISVSVTQSDAAGNTSTSTWTTTKDTTAPAAPSGAEVDSSPADTINADDQSEVTVSVPGDGDGAAQLFVRLSAGGQSVTASQPAAVRRVVLDASSLPDGPVDVSAWQVDAAGNTSAVADGVAAVKDTAVPAQLVIGTDQGRYVNAAEAADVTLSGTLDAPLGSGGTARITVAGEDYPADVNGTDVSVSGLDLSGQPDGPIAVESTVTDAAGNTSHWQGQLVKDTVAPAPLSLDLAGSGATSAAYVNAAGAADAALAGTLGASEGDAVAVTVAGHDEQADVSGTDVSVSGLDLSAEPDGPIAVTTTVTDPAGNAATWQGQIVKDTTPPASPLYADVVTAGGAPRPAIPAADAGCVHVDVSFAQPGDASDTVTARLRDAAGAEAGAEADGGAAKVELGCIDAGALLPGPLSLLVTVTDAAGNAVSFDGTAAQLLPAAG